MAQRKTIALPRTFAVMLAAGVTLCALTGQAQEAANDECTGLAEQAAEIACLREALEVSRKALGEAGGRANPAASPPAPVERPPAAATESGATVLGDEQASRATTQASPERSGPDRVAATITASRADRRGFLVMQLDNGQIWRQGDGTELPVRIGEDEQVRVEIARSGFGGYRMSFPDMGRRIAVSRLR